MSAPHPLQFFSLLKWLDGRPLLDTIEPYRRDIFTKVLYTFEPNGHPQFNLVLCGRAKKNWKSADLALAALYRFLTWPSPQGNDCSLLANDEDQADDDLSLIKKLIAANPILDKAVNVQTRTIARKDGRGILETLPAKDVAGAHGKTKLFIGFDEIHAYRNHDLFEALAPDPTRLDALTWITSYSSIRHAVGVPLYDYLEMGKSGDDPRMFFSWYGGDFTTDPAYTDKAPEERANPSMESWGNPGYLSQQKRRLPTHKYRRLHLNLPGAPDGAAFQAASIYDAVVPGRKRLPWEAGLRYQAFVDMSGGSKDEAFLAIGHRDPVSKHAVLDLIESQLGRPPFNPRSAVQRFAGLLREYNLSTVTGDAYAGQTFRADFAEHQITYVVSPKSASELYEDFEPHLNAGEVELLDHPKMVEQFLTLVIRGSKITHQNGGHDDASNACAGCLGLLMSKPSFMAHITPAAVSRFSKPYVPHLKPKVFVT